MSSYLSNGYSGVYTTPVYPAKPALKVGDKVKYKETFGSGFIKYNGVDTGEIKHMVNADSALVVYPANPSRGFYKDYGAIIGLNRLVKADKFESGWYRLKNFKDYVYYVKDNGNGVQTYTHVYHVPTKQLEALAGGGTTVGTVLHGDLIKMEFVSAL